MLDHLREQVVTALTQVNKVTFASHGPAGLQTSVLPCESAGMRLYLLVPRTSDHLLNIEAEPECVALAPDWELRGQARRILLSDHPGLLLPRAPELEWSVLVEIRPTQLNLLRPGEGGYSASIDIDESPDFGM